MLKEKGMSTKELRRKAKTNAKGQNDIQGHRQDREPDLQGQAQDPGLEA